MQPYVLQIDRKQLNMLDQDRVHHIQELVNYATRNLRPDGLYLAASLLLDVARDQPKRSSTYYQAIEDADRLSDISPAMEFELIFRLRRSTLDFSRTASESSRFTELRLCYMEKKMRMESFDDRGNPNE